MWTFFLKGIMSGLTFDICIGNRQGQKYKFLEIREYGL